MPQFWIAAFFILLAVAQVYQSIKDINLPFPVYLVLGTVLAVASNANQKLAFGSSSNERVTLQEIKQPAPAISAPIASPSLVATQTPELAPVPIENRQPEMAPAPVTLPKVAPKQTQAIAPQFEEQPPKKAPKRKTTRKPKQALGEGETGGAGDWGSGRLGER